MSNAPSDERPLDRSFSPRMLSTLNVAAFITWVAITAAAIEIGKLRAGDPREWAGFAALLCFMALYGACANGDRLSDRWRNVLVVTQGLLALLADRLLENGQTAILLIVVAGQFVMMVPLRTFLFWMFVFNAAYALQWMGRFDSPFDVLLSMLQIVAFQTFAALTGHYAVSRERAREHLAQVNTELLATRRLLEESARAGERLKLSRELHDVAGHSLTALKLNLARLARDPVLAGREELTISTQLADDLLAQIRQVVGALRAHDGLDLRAALEALSRPVPGVRVDLDIQDGLRVDDLDQAEALLRCAQEAITNALRHGRARTIAIRLQREGDRLELSIKNDGIAPSRIQYGNGLTGMRERLAAVGGRLDIEATPPRGLCVIARIEEAQA